MSVRTFENKPQRMKDCEHSRVSKYSGYENPMRYCMDCAMIWYGDDIENGY